MQYTLLYLSGILLLLILLYQDFKFREISAGLLVLFALVVVLLGTLEHGIQVFLSNAFINTIIISIQLLLLKFVFSLKAGKSVVLADYLIGWGDILFIYVCGWLLSPLNFMLYFVGTLAIILLFFGLYSLIKPQKTTVPLVGAMAGTLVVILLPAAFGISFNRLSDDYLLVQLAQLLR